MTWRAPDFSLQEMSTFKGVVKEFPQIRIDYFRRSPYEPPPLAAFLSHVHSDHLAGLESLRAPFVYCSPATREVSHACIDCAMNTAEQNADTAPLGEVPSSYELCERDPRVKNPNI